MDFVENRRNDRPAVAEGDLQGGSDDRTTAENSVKRKRRNPEPPLVKRKRSSGTVSKLKIIKLGPMEQSPIAPGRASLGQA